MSPGSSTSWRKVGTSSPDGARANPPACSRRPRTFGEDRRTAMCATSRLPVPRPDASRKPAPLGRGGEDRCAFDHGRPPGPRQRAGIPHQRQPDAGAAVVPAHAGALPRRPAGRGAARLPGPPRHPRGRVGHRAGPRRRLVGARHPHPGARAALPGPSRARRRLARLRTRGDVPSPPSRRGARPATGEPVRRPRARVGPAARLVGIGPRRRGAPPPRRRGSRHREDAARGRARARRGGGRGAGPVGALRRGPRGTLPACGRSSRPLLPDALGRLDLTHA